MPPLILVLHAKNRTKGKKIEKKIEKGTEMKGAKSTSCDSDTTSSSS